MRFLRGFVGVRVKTPGKNARLVKIPDLRKNATREARGANGDHRPYPPHPDTLTPSGTSRTSTASAETEVTLIRKRTSP